MNNLSISKTKDYFEKDGRKFFYLADTMWTAFSNITLDEWEEYLGYRKMQGFNALQMNILTQWDGGKPDSGLYPFKIDPCGKFDFYSLSEEYFKRARTMLDMAVQKDFIPVLVILWGNYVKDTWMSNNNPVNIMSLDVVKSYTEYVVRLFTSYNPIYMISGDTDFGSAETVCYYTTAMEAVKKICPDALTTLHLSCGVHQLPENIEESELYSFYTYQSSHNIESQDLAYKLAEKFYEKPVKRPIINSEPCYEGHLFGGKYGRYNEFHVRKAIWQSLLSGAKAGVTYGAHGLWCLYRDGKEFSNESYGGRPHPWRTGLRYKGAWEASFAKWVFETYDLFDLEPCSAILNDTREIRMSVSKDASKAALYVPYNIDVRTSIDLGGYDWTLVNLTDKLFAKPEIKIEDGLSIIKMHAFNSDVLLIGVKK